ncbi:MAG: hypothetical protein PHY93_15375 [Bacteriovorax sp.]|nr:hypothetical protein [Bacteriovorax sp.]
MKSLILCLILSTMGSIGSASADVSNYPNSHIKKVMIPGADKFIPFAMQIKAGDTVQWTNGDTDDHTVVSDDAFTSPGFGKMNALISGTDHNGGHPGVLKKTFNHPGIFVYYCRFHSKLDKDNQPIAPGPDGGIQDDKGNFGTPMMGVITVMPRY